MANEAVRVTCPHCQGTLKVVVLAPGERQTCPKCGGAFVPPAPANATKSSAQESWDDLLDPSPVSVSGVSPPSTPPRPAPAPSTPAKPLAPPSLPPSPSASSPPLPPLPFDDSPSDDESPRSSAASSSAPSTTHSADANDDDEFQLAAPIVPPPPTIPAVVNLAVAELAGRFTFGVACPVCNTRIECLNTDVGQSTRCPDCHSNFPIPAPREHQARTQVGAKRGATGETEEFAPVPPPSADPHALESATQRKVAASYLEQAKAEQEALEAAASETFDERKAADLFVFLFQPLTLARLAGVAVLALIAIAMLRGAAPLFSQESKNFVLLGFLVAAAPTTAAWLIAAGAHAVALFQSTTLRQKQITWPEVNIFEWLGPGLYAVLGALYSGLPGAVVGKLLFSGEGSWPYLSFCVVSSWFVLFPVTFVSMAHEASLFALVSGAVYRSLSEVRGAWVLFYETSGLLALVGWGVMVSAFAESSIAAFFFAAMTTLLGTIYFRLLGWTVSQLGDVLSPEVEEVEEKCSTPPAGSSPVASGSSPPHDASRTTR